MWMTEHLANIELGRTFGKVFADIPLKDSAHIVHGDALAIAWDDMLPREECFAVMGNPPFAGAKFQSAEQRQQVRKLARLGGSGGTLDFVAAWFIKAGEYCSCISIGNGLRSEEHTSELQSLMRTSYAVFCLNKKTSNRT